MLNYNTFGLICLVVLSCHWSFRRYVGHNRLRQLPGPKLYALSSYRLALDAWNARSIHSIRALHQRYGSVVRVGPNQVSFNSLSALRTIYGAGSGFERTPFYSMFDAYGRPNLFTFYSAIEHRNRKKLVSHMYSNQKLMEDHAVNMVKRKVSGFLKMLDREPQLAGEIFTSLHYFSFDAISEFVYGPEMGGTNALSGNKVDRRLIDDILDPARRRLAWFLVHFPRYTKWIISRTGLTEVVLNKLGLMPMKKPFTYSGIRRHALEAFYQHKKAREGKSSTNFGESVMNRLFEVRQQQNLTDMDIASECADHLLAGIDTTSDSLMFMVWALSLPKHLKYQDRLQKELQALREGHDGWHDPKDLAKLPWLNAVVKESLRLYTPLPAFEPRLARTDTTIDGFQIPANTIVGMSPYAMHREESVYPDPTEFRPERWLQEDGSLLPESALQNKWFWAFSSGARMCIGMHLAMSEMLMLLAAVYKQYTTSARHPEMSPAITSRYEVFHDETFDQISEHECHIDFHKLSR